MAVMATLSVVCVLIMNSLLKPGRPWFLFGLHQNVVLLIAGYRRHWCRQTIANNVWFFNSLKPIFGITMSKETGNDSNKSDLLSMPSEFTIAVGFHFNLECGQERVTYFCPTRSIRLVTIHNDRWENFFMTGNASSWRLLRAKSSWPGCQFSPKEGANSPSKAKLVLMLISINEKNRPSQTQTAMHATNEGNYAEKLKFEWLREHQRESTLYCKGEKK